MTYFPLFLIVSDIAVVKVALYTWRYPVGRIVGTFFGQIA